jgi:hypothetical protein
MAPGNVPGRMDEAAEEPDIGSWRHRPLYQCHGLENFSSEYDVNGSILISLFVTDEHATPYVDGTLLSRESLSSLKVVQVAPTRP